jgi:hypothetical protein
VAKDGVSSGDLVKEVKKWRNWSLCLFAVWTLRLGVVKVQLLFVYQAYICVKSTSQGSYAIGQCCNWGRKSECQSHPTEELNCSRDASSWESSGLVSYGR